MYEAEEEVPKWQYQRGKYPKQDVIRDVQLSGSSTHLRFANAQIAVSFFCKCKYQKSRSFHIKSVNRRLSNAVRKKLFHTVLCGALSGILLSADPGHHDLFV